MACDGLWSGIIIFAGVQLLNIAFKTPVNLELTLYFIHLPVIMIKALFWNIPPIAYLFLLNALLKDICIFLSKCRELRSQRPCCSPT
jgi:hypothetical protein